MSVDRNKVLYGNPIKAIRIKHRALTEKPSITREDARTYYEAYADKPMRFTLEASRYIFSEPISGLNYYKEYVENHTIPLFALREESAKLDEYISNFKEYFSPGTLVRYEAVSEMLHNKINGLKNSILLSEGADKSEEMKARIIDLYDGALEAVEDTIQVQKEPSSTSNDTSSDKPESVIAKFHKKATSVKEEGGSDEVKIDSGKSMQDFDKEAEKLQKDADSVMKESAKPLDESYILECAYPDVMYYLIENEMTDEISRLIDWHFTESPESVRAFKEDADIVIMTNMMLRDSYISEKVDQLPSPSVSEKIRDVAGVSVKELMDTVTVESGDRSSVVYIDPLQAIRSMQMDKLIQEDVIDPMDKVHRKLCSYAVLESAINFKTMVNDAEWYQEMSSDDEDLFIDIDDEDLESHIYSSDDIAALIGDDGFELPEECANESAGCAGILGYKVYAERTKSNDVNRIDAQRKVVRVRDDEETDKKKIEKKKESESSNPSEDLDEDIDDLEEFEDDLEESEKKKDSKSDKKQKPVDPGPAPKQAMSSKAMDKSIKDSSKGNKLKEAAGEAKRTAMALMKVPKAIINAVKRQIDEWEQMGDDKRKQKMLEPGFRKNYYKKMRHAIAYGIAFAINPLLDIMVFFVNYCNKERDARLRNELLHELEAEVKICDEKIRDADSGDDKKKKYQLMRIKDKLQAEIIRVRTNSRYI